MNARSPDRHRRSRSLVFCLRTSQFERQKTNNRQPVSTMNSASNNNTCPSHTPSQRRGSTDSFGCAYNEKENAIFLHLAKSAFEEDDDEDSVCTTPFSVQCGEDESEASINFDEDDDGMFQFLMRTKKMFRSSANTRTKAVTFGVVSVCEFKRKDSPMLVSRKDIRETTLAMPVSVFEYSKVLRPLSPFAMKMRRRRLRRKHE